MRPTSHNPKQERRAPMTRTAALRLCFLLCIPGVFQAESQTLPVVPKPRVVYHLGGVVHYVPSHTTIRLALRDTTSVLPALEEICNLSRTLFGESPSQGHARPTVVWAGVPGFIPAFDRLCRNEKITPGDSLGSEGYTLLVDRSKILIAATSGRGVFYGLQTFLQLLRGAATNGGRIPAVHIIDWPALRARGIMDDISRGPVPTTEYFREQIRRCAEIKVNTISYYTEHMVLTQSHPEFAPAGAALSIEEWKALSQYARRYHIDLVGNFQSFGHFDKILAQPAYAHLGEGRSLLSPVLEDSYGFLRDIYREMVPAFDAPFFMTNCDETFDLGKGASRKLVDSLGIGRVYVGHVLRLREILQQLGTRMMIWGDVLLQHPEVIDLVPKDVVIGTWNYDSLTDYHRYIVPFRSRGFDVLVAPGILNSNCALPDFPQSLVNIQRFVSDALSDQVTGAMTTVWDDGGSALFSRDWYGVAFAADRMWNCDTTDITCDDRFDMALYGDAVRGSSRGINCLLRIAQLTPTDGMNERILWSPAFPAEGKLLRLNLGEWDHVLAIARQSDSLFSAGRPLIRRGDLEALRFTANLYEVTARLHFGVRDASQLYAHAITVGKADKEKCGSDLLSAVEILATLQQEYSSLKDRYATLWLRENRTYALDSVEHSYDRRIDELRDVERRVQAALADFEAGKLLPPPQAVRLATVESDGWYLRDWLIAGPIGGNRLDVDYLRGAGGEAEVSPLVTQEFSWDSTTYRWRRFSAPDPAEADFSFEFPGITQSTVYAFATIESPTDRTVRALLGAGGFVRLYVNGRPVFEGEGPLTVDRDSISLPLMAGKNRLLLKASDAGKGAWGFSLYLTDSSIRNRKNRYRIED